MRIQILLFFVSIIFCSLVGCADKYVGEFLHYDKSYDFPYFDDWDTNTEHPSTKIERYESIEQIKDLLKSKEESGKIFAELRNGGVLTDAIIVSKGFYVIQDDIEIAETGILAIEAGTTFNFKEDTGIFCEGTIVADGSADDYITFTALDETKRWQNLTFIGEQSSKSTLKYCRISYGIGFDYTKMLFHPFHGCNQLEYRCPYYKSGAKATEYQAIINVYDNSNVKFENCCFENNDGQLIEIYKSKLQLSNCSFSKNRDLGVLKYSQCIFDNCEFIENYQFLFSIVACNALIKNCKFQKNDKFYMSSINSNIHLQNCVISENTALFSNLFYYSSNLANAFKDYYKLDENYYKNFIYGRNDTYNGHRIDEAWFNTLIIEECKIIDNNCEVNKDLSNDWTRCIKDDYTSLYAVYIDPVHSNIYLIDTDISGNEPKDLKFQSYIVGERHSMISID